MGEDESRVRSSLQQQLRNAAGELEGAREVACEERELRAELQRQLAKSGGEVQQWRARCEVEGLARAEELEEAKRKLAARLDEAEEQVDQALTKCASLEKVWPKVNAEKLN